MRALSLGFAVLGLGLALSGCVYYPDGPYAAYGPDWCNYHPRRYAAYGPPPPPGYAGPPPGYAAGPPPGYQGPPPAGYGPPPPQGYPPPAQSAAPQGENSAPTQQQLAKVNNPTWCNNHPRKCEALRERFGMAPPGSRPQQGYGPPPANGAPTPLNNNGSQGSPPGQ